MTNEVSILAYFILILSLFYQNFCADDHSKYKARQAAVFFAQTHILHHNFQRQNLYATLLRVVLQDFLEFTTHKRE